MPFGAIRLSGRSQELKRTGTTACLIIMIMALTGCGFMPFGKKDTTQSPVPPPPPIEKASAQSPNEDITPPQNDLAAPPAIPPPADHTAQTSPAGYVQVPIPPPDLSPPMDPIVAAGKLQLGKDSNMGALGVNLDEYFDDSETLDTRVKRVERAVNAIQKDLKTLAPPIKRLITVERDIQELVAQLADFVQAPPPAQEPVKEPETGSLSAPPHNQMVMPASMAATSSVISKNLISGGHNVPFSGTTPYVKRVRIGEHRDKTRIVLDTNIPASYRYDLDNTERLLVIELPYASWSAKMGATLKKSPMIASYKVHTMPQGGSRVVIQLKKSTSVEYESVIKANGYKDYRIFLDLKK